MVDSTKYLNAVESFVEIAGPTAPSEKKDQSKAEKPQATINILIARFLADEIVQSFTPERLKEIKSFDPTKLDEEERVAHEAVDDFSRGISEIEIQ